MSLNGVGVRATALEAGRPDSGEGATERWLVMKIGPDWMLLVSREGEFRRMPLPAAPVRPGEEIDLPVRPEVTTHAGTEVGRMTTHVGTWVGRESPATGRRFRMGWKVYAAAAAVALLALAPVLRTALAPGLRSGLAPALGSLLAPRPSAVVAIDINPSLELELDSRTRVLRGVPRNEDGRAVLSALDLRGLDVYTATERVVRRSQEAGFIAGDRDNLVLAAVVELGSGKPGASVPETKKLEMAIVSALKERGAGGFVAVSRVKPEIRDTAISQGVSVNKYIVLEKVRSMGKAPSAQEARSESVKSILDRAGLEPGSVFPSGKGVRSSPDDSESSAPGTPASGLNDSQPATAPGAERPAPSPAPSQERPQVQPPEQIQVQPQKRPQEHQQEQPQMQPQDASPPQNAPPPPGAQPSASDLHDDRKEKTENGEERDSSQNEKEKPSGQSDDEEGNEPPEVE